MVIVPLTIVFYLIKNKITLNLSNFYNIKLVFMIKHCLFALLLLIFFIPVSAQNLQEIESLKAKLKLQTNEPARMHIKLEIGDKFQELNSDSALYWYSSIVPKLFSDSTFYANWVENSEDSEKYYVSVGLGRSGVLLFQMGDKQKGVSRLEIALEVSLLINQPQLALYCSNNLAVSFAKEKSFERASIYFERSLGINKEINDVNGIVYCLGNLGAINASTGQYYKAAEYYEQLLGVQQQSSSSLETLDDIINIAALYQRIDEFEKSRIYWEKALSIASQSETSSRFSTVLSNLGTINYKLTKFDAAISNFEKLLEIAQQSGSKHDELLALQNLALLQYSKGNMQASLDYWSKTFEAGKVLGNGPVILDALLNLSNINYQLKNFEKASQYYDGYISVGKQMGDTKAMAQSLLNAGEIQEKILSFDKARDYYLQALKMFEESTDTVGIACSNIAIGKTFQKQQRYFPALDFYEANIEMGSSIGNKNIAETYQCKADVFRLQQQYTKALELYLKALEIREKLTDQNQVSVCLNYIGYIYEVTGNIPKAVTYYERALDVALATGNKESISALYNNMGVVYRKLGDSTKALASYEKSLAINLGLNNQEGASYCYNNMGIIFENSGDFAKANEYYEKSLAIKEGSQDKQGLATSLMNMGNVYKHLKNYTKAEESYNKSLEISESIGDKPGMALALGSLASLSIETNSYDKSIEFAIRSLTLSKEIDLQSAIKEANRLLAWAYSATNVPEWAEEAHRNVIDMNHADINRNFSILSESEKELYFKTVSVDFDRFHSFALTRQKTNPTITQLVYDNILKNKGLLLKSGTAMRNAILGSNDKQLIENFEKWIAIRQDIAKLYTLPVDERNLDPVYLETQANDLERLLVRSSSVFSDFESSIKISWTTVRDKLKEGEVAVEFTHFVHNRDSVMYCALIVKPQSESPQLIPLFEEKQLVKIIGNFGGNNYSYINSIYGKNSEANSSLYNLVWQPLAAHLEGVKVVYVSPSGLLHKIAFSAISKGLNSYVIDNFDLHVLSTTGYIASGNTLGIDSETSISLFGGIAYTTQPETTETWTYLKGTLDESIMVKSIAQSQLSNINLYTDSLATEAAFKLAAPKSRILHIATHGFFFPDPKDVEVAIDAVKEIGEVEFRGGGARTHGLNNFVRSQNPLMRSGLVFAGVNDYWNGNKSVTGDDGVLTALEVINIDLRKNKLVVMSACETGLGDIAGSEGVYGLQRAFKMAGTSFLIMSLWQVPDKETAEFMEVFYKELLLTKDLQKAFSLTQKSMRSKYDPYYWAAFVLLE